MAKKGRLRDLINLTDAGVVACAGVGHLSHCSNASMSCMIGVMDAEAGSMLHDDPIRPESFVNIKNECQHSGRVHRALECLSR